MLVGSDPSQDQSSDRPIRLLVVSQPLEAGTPAQVIRLLERMDPSQVVAEVACPKASTLWRHVAEHRPELRLHPIPPARAPSPADVATLWRLVRLARAFDVVHAHSSKAGFLARLAATLTGTATRCIFTPHGWSFWSARGAPARLYLLLEQWAADRCAAIVACSRHELESGLGAGVGRRERYRLIPNGIDTAQFKLPRRPQERTLVAVGRLAPPKRFDVVLRAMARLPKDVRLSIVGDGPQSAALLALRDSLGIADRVEFLGSRDDVPEILARHAVAVLVSDYEGSPLSVIEAMAAGLPVVAAHVGGVPELVADGATGRLVSPGDPEALAAALRELLADPDRARAMGRRAAAAAERFDAGQMAERYAGLYREVSRLPRRRRAGAIR